MTGTNTQTRIPSKRTGRLTARLARPVPLAIALTLAAVWTPAAAEAPREVDLELVLAVDASGSVDAREFELQTSGIAAGFRDEAVLAALRSGVHGRIAVALVIWADSSTPKDASPWHVIADRTDAETFARMVESYPRRVRGGTGIGEAVAFSARQFSGNGLAGTRRVIDLSGDGAETTPRDFVLTPRLARIFALSRGITINALAILTDEPDLESYYRSEIVGGPGAFVLSATSYEDFARAIRTKLLREIEYRPKVSHGRGARPPFHRGDPLDEDSLERHGRRESPTSHGPDAVVAGGAGTLGTAVVKPPAPTALLANCPHGAPPRTLCQIWGIPGRGP